MTNKIEQKSEMFSFKQPYHEHQCTMFKSINTKVVVSNILHIFTLLWKFEEKISCDLKEN